MAGTLPRRPGKSIDASPEVASYVLARARELITEDKRGRSFAAQAPVRPEATALAAADRVHRPAAVSWPAQPPVTVIETAGWASSAASTKSPARRAAAAARLTTAPAAGSVPCPVAV